MHEIHLMEKNKTFAIFQPRYSSKWILLHFWNSSTEFLQNKKFIKISKPIYAYEDSKKLDKKQWTCYKIPFVTIQRLFTKLFLPWRNWRTHWKISKTSFLLPWPDTITINFWTCSKFALKSLSSCDLKFINVPANK